jgi:hypothetical protein
MGTFTGGGIDFAAISTEMRSTMLPWMNGTIQIIDPNIGEQEWDAFTNEYSTDTSEILWQGPARIQHLSSESMPYVGSSQIGVRGIRLQVPMDTELGFVRKGLQVIVIDGGSDPELEQLQFLVTSSINSSYAWGKTIECEVDVKSVANSTWSGIAGTVTNATSQAIANATVRSFHHEDNLWIMDYETTTDTLGNYELPADAGVPVALVASASGFITEYYDGASGFDGATTVTPVNHEETQNIDFELVID